MCLGMNLTCTIKKGNLTLAGTRDTCRANGINSHYRCTDVHLTDREVQERDESGNSKEKSITKAYINTDKGESEKNI